MATVKVVRPNGLSKKASPGTNSARVQLETVLGCTVVSNTGLVFSPSSGIIAYSAGCVIVLWEPETDQQQHLIAPNKRTISALAFSYDGRYLASGECGQTPCIRIWDPRDGSQLYELSGHKSGITFLAFSPDSRQLISVGTHHDNLVIVWDWRATRMIASNKLSCKVKGISFSEDGAFFITVGNRHVKYWYLDVSEDSQSNRSVTPLIGRSAILGEYKDEYFLDVVCGRGSCSDYAYAATQSGYLVQFNSRRSLEKMVSLKSSEGSCLSATESGIVVGSSNGNVRIYHPVTLNQIRVLPHPHQLGVDLPQYPTADLLQHRAVGQLTFPDAVAVTCDDNRKRVTVIYNDHSVYCWDIRDPKSTSKIKSHLFHSRCVWGIDISSTGMLDMPDGSFITCSSDDTVRIWSLKASTDGSSQSNIFCEYSKKIIYNDPSLLYLCNKETNPGGADPQDVHTDSRYGIRCVRVDPHGTNIAFGDRMGNIHVYTLSDMHETYKIEAHEAEVLCLEYSSPDTGYEFLASASRDRLIQIFDVRNDYDCIQTLDDHSSSITALRFTMLGAHQFGLVSCGVDKAIILRTVQRSADNSSKFVLNDQILSKGGIVYDMCIEPATSTLITANQDRNLRMYGLKSRKLERTTKGSATDEGALIKLDLHSTGRFVATSCSDKNLAVVDIVNGDCWASFSGHSELVTGLRFDLNNRRIISVSGDSCIFVWRINGDLTTSGVKNLETPERGHALLSPSESVRSYSELSLTGTDVTDEEAPYPRRPGSLALDETPLPSWARARMAASPVVESSKINRPSGKWAEDMDELPTPVNQNQPVRSISPMDINGPLIGVSSGGIAWVDTTPAANGRPSPTLRPPSLSRTLSSTSASTSSSVSGSQRRTPKAEPPLASPNAAIDNDAQPKILGLLGRVRRPQRDELEDDEVFDNASVSSAETRISQARSGVERTLLVPNASSTSLKLKDLETESIVSTSSRASSPVVSRPDTPSEAANKFLNLNAAAIDKVSKGRLPNRQSVTIKHGPLVATVPAEKPAEVDMKLAAAAAAASPSQKLIQNIKLLQSKQRYQSTQNLSLAAQEEEDGTENRSGGRRTDSQGATSNVRRATSMNDLSGPTPTTNLDGYKSLLERAKARLTAAAQKDSDSDRDSVQSVPTRSRGPRRISTTVGAEGDTPPVTDRSKAPVPLRERRLRSVSSERTRTPVGDVSVLSSSSSRTNSDEKPSPRKAILERRIRRDSATKTPTKLQSSPVVTADSPTSSAIARIKAEIGLISKPTTAVDSIDVETSQDDPKLLKARNGCEKFTNVLDELVCDYQREDSVHARDLYQKTLLDAHNRIAAALKNSQPQDQI